MMSRTTWLALALMSAIGIVGLPRTARASFDDAGVGLMITSIAVGVPTYVTISAVLIGEGSDDAIHRGHGLAEAGAIVEIVWGAIHIAAGAGTIIGASVSRANATWFDDSVLGGLIGVGSFLGLLGGVYLGHGIWSLGEGRPPTVTASLVPVDGGIYASGRLAF